MLRRDPSLAAKLSLVDKVEALVEEYKSVYDVPSDLRRALEGYSGFLWRKLVQWFNQRDRLKSEFSRLRLGRWGPNPFGSNRKGQDRKSRSTGARLPRQELENYQSAVLKSLKSWVDKKRSVGSTVSSMTMRHRYLQLLEQATVARKLELVQLREAIQSAAPDSDLRPLQKAVKVATEYRDQLVSRVAQMQTVKELVSGRYWQTILAQLGCSRYHMQRVTQCPPAEVRNRVRLTWQSFDYAQYVAVNGSDEEPLHQF